MVEAILRKTLFSQVPFVDVQIAAGQQSILRTLDLTVEDDVTYAATYLDHQQPFHTHLPHTKEWFVMAYPAQSIEGFKRQLPQATTLFYEALGITTLYIATEVVLDWADFLFETREKKEAFLKAVGHITADCGYKIDRDDLLSFLPHFMLAHPDRAPVYFIAEAPVAFSMFLCKDGNWHLQYYEEDKETIVKAAAGTGFLVGDVELCWQYYW